MNYLILGINGEVGAIFKALYNSNDKFILTYNSKSQIKNKNIFLISLILRK